LGRVGERVIDAEAREEIFGRGFPERGTTRNRTVNFDQRILNGPDDLNLLDQTRCMTYDQLEYNSKDWSRSIFKPKL
jgi:hypothetical protein